MVLVCQCHSEPGLQSNTDTQRRPFRAANTKHFLLPDAVMAPHIRVVAGGGAALKDVPRRATRGSGMLPVIDSLFGLRDLPKTAKQGESFSW